ncbi:hypothetical protein M5K25_019542 [Dendrobium thyrsiflorum]|uniref:Uncharacterized protein n=1 Tax=Dendrobium thyrsiflorum TaxID=117978 RepID=A0ABD0UFB7_DENTH
MEVLMAMTSDELMCADAERIQSPIKMCHVTRYSVLGLNTRYRASVLLGTEAQYRSVLERKPDGRTVRCPHRIISPRLHIEYLAHLQRALMRNMEHCNVLGTDLPEKCINVVNCNPLQESRIPPSLESRIDESVISTIESAVKDSTSSVVLRVIDLEPNKDGDAIKEHHLEVIISLMKILVTISHDTAEHVEVLGANPSYEDSFLHWNSINWKKLDTYKEDNRMDCRKICNKVREDVRHTTGQFETSRKSIKHTGYVVLASAGSENSRPCLGLFLSFGSSWRVLTRPTRCRCRAEAGDRNGVYVGNQWRTGGVRKRAARETHGMRRRAWCTRCTRVAREKRTSRVRAGLMIVQVAVCACAGSQYYRVAVRAGGVTCKWRLVHVETYVSRSRIAIGVKDHGAEQMGEARTGASAMECERDALGCGGVSRSGSSNLWWLFIIEAITEKRFEKDRESQKMGGGGEESCFGEW